MSTQRHVIQQQIVEVTLANKDQAWELQQTLSRIFQSRLPTVLDRCLSEVSTANYLQRIDRLELDIGEFESDFSTDEWLGRVEVSLRQALSEQLEQMPELSAQSPVLTQIAHQNHNESKEAMVSDTDPLAINPESSKLIPLPSVPKVYQDHTLQSELDLLEHFIQEGYLPWWADSRQRHLPEITLINLLKTESEALRQLLVRLIKEPRSLRRLLSYFNNDYLQIITVLLSASSEDLVIKLLSILREAQGSIHQQSISPAVQASIQSEPIDSPVLTPLHSPISQLRLKATCWQSLLQVLVTGRPVFNQYADFLRAVTLRWANLLGISQAPLIKQLQQNHLSTEAIENEWLRAIQLLASDYSLKSGNINVKSDNAAHLEAEQINSDESVNDPLTISPQSLLAPVPKAYQDHTLQSELDLLEHFIQEGHLPGGADSRQRHLPEITLINLLKTEPEALRQLLVRLIKEPRSLQRLLSYFNINQTQLIKQLQHNHLSTEVIDNEWLSAIQLLASDYPLRSGNINVKSDNAARIEAGRINSGQINSEESVTDLLTTSPHVSKPSANPETLQTLTAFSDTDALYINNAGLCLLWPFLGAFFESLDLMHNNRFHDLAAQQCAVSLLHYVATADVNPPEYQLPFNKLLCAMDIAEVFEMQAPLTTLQMEACDALLLEVIDTAPILNNMSINGFRGSFLLRSGSLSGSDGCWLLRVEQQTYDLVLARFPWTWQWVKLPWMEYPLRVEWSCT